MEKLEKSKLRLLYADILRGYSVANLDSKSVFIKHLSSLDFTEIDIKNELFFDQAVKNDFPTEKDQFNYLLQNGLWSQDKENEMSSYRLAIERSEDTKKKFFRKTEIDAINRQINEFKDKISRLKWEKDTKMETTAESYAQRKTGEFYIFNSLYKDRDLTERLYTEKIFDELEDTELRKINDIYNNITKYFNTLNIQRIALSGFFLNSLSISKSNPFIFFGKPIINLTYYQIELFGQGLMFKNMLSEMEQKPDEDLLDNPEQFMEFNNANKNLQQNNASQKGQEGVTQVTMGKEDMEYLHIRNSGGKTMSQKASDEMKKQGKTKMSMEELRAKKLI